MKKFITLILSFILLIGCSNSQTDEGSNEETNKESNEKTDDNQQVKEDPVANDEANDETNNEELVTENNENENENELTQEKEGLLVYRPKVGSEMIYTKDGEEMFVYNIIAENDEYVQLTISIGESPTTHIYKWTATEITLVYEDPSASDPKINLLTDFKPTEAKTLESVVNLLGSADWKLLSETESITVPYGTFNDVYVLEKVTDDVENADTIFRRYYAPEVGLIKETFELTGENGYKDEAHLEEIN